MTRYEAIFRRKSVRKYTNEEIDGWTLERIERFGMDAISVRPDIRVKWHIFRAADQKLKGMFQVKAPYYAALYSEICEDYQENAGCLMEPPLSEPSAITHSERATAAAEPPEEPPGTCAGFAGFFVTP